MERSGPFRGHQKKTLGISPEARAPKQANAVALQLATCDGGQFCCDLHPKNGSSTRKCATSKIRRNSLKTIVHSFSTQSPNHLIRLAEIQQKNLPLEHADPPSRSSIYSPLARPL